MSQEHFLEGNYKTKAGMKSGGEKKISLALMFIFSNNLFSIATPNFYQPQYLSELGVWTEFKNATTPLSPKKQTNK